MQLAFLIYKYFPYGGQQRDFAAIAQECVRRGHQVDAYCLQWQGEAIPGVNRHRVPMRGLTRLGQYRRYTAWMARALAANRPELVLGFNRMPLLDLHYAADPCFAEKAATRRGYYYRFTPRCRHFMDYEYAVFGPDSNTEVMILSPQQQDEFSMHYPGCEPRLHLLPPGLKSDRLVTKAHRQNRAALRTELGLTEGELLLLQVGSGFRVKGVNRALFALACLPDSLRYRCRYLLIGQDNPAPYLHLARQLDLTEHITILPGRPDIPRYLAAADLLLHPAYEENAGYTLLEAACAGLPVLTTATCGYAFHIQAANSGLVCTEPFRQQELNAKLQHMLSLLPLTPWSSNGLQYATHLNPRDQPSAAVDLIEQMGPRSETLTERPDRYASE